MDLPPTTGAFFGRDPELEEIARYLADPQCRLITLVGPGGIGKTRLGIEAARIYRDTTGLESVFVDLQSARGVTQLENALASAFQVTVMERKSSIRQIAGFVADTDLLLVLDNFDDVVDAASAIGELLDGSPGLKILVTSRQPLRLTQEWLIPLDGLPVPQPIRLRDSTSSPSIRLFTDRVRQVKPNVSLADEISAIERICRLSGGMPLALEIAASWAHVLTLSEIADEMARDTRFLSSRLRNIPQRHRSMQLVFEHSMKLLNDEERTAFHRLSVFAGGFTRPAALAVAGADQVFLASLVERSLLKQSPDGRYRIHELIRQYAAERLSDSGEHLESTRDAHSRYFMEFLSKRWENISSHRQAETAGEVEGDYDNIRAAWAYAVANRRSTAVHDAAETLAMFFQFRGRFLEAGELFADAVAAFREEPIPQDRLDALAQLLSEHGWFSLRLGRLDAADAALRESLALREAHSIPVKGFAVDPGLARAYVASTRGDLESAKRFATDALERAREGAIHLAHAMIASNLLAHVKLRTGDLDGARRYARAALDTGRQVGDRWFSVFCHQVLGEVEALAGNVELAKEEFQTSLETTEAFGDRAGSALSHVHLGELSVLTNSFEEAFHHFDRGRDAYMQTGDVGGRARGEAGLGLASAGLGDHATAAQWFRTALDTARSIGLQPVLLDILANVGMLGLSRGLGKDSDPLLRSVAIQESVDERTRARIISVLRNLDEGRPREEDAPVNYDLAYSILGKVAAEHSEAMRGKGVPETGPYSGRGMSEPLTDREIEIMSLLAQGFSNQQIASHLVISLSTVKWHNYQIYTKLGVSNRTSAVAMARRAGILASETSV